MSDSIQRLYDAVKSAHAHDAPASRTAKLLREGTTKIAKKLAEEAVEVGHEAILRDTLLVSVGGSRVGQVNGLAVLSLDDFMFAHPVRITATSRIGEGDVIDIEREAELRASVRPENLASVAVATSLGLTLVDEHVDGAGRALQIFQGKVADLA